MDEKDTISTVDSSLETTPQSSNIVDRILQESMTNDFGVPKTKTIGDIAKEYDMRMTPFDADRIVEKAGLYTSVGDQTAAAVKNVLVDLSGLGDKVRLAYGNTTNMFSGGKIGEETQNIAFDNLGKLYEDMAYREKNVGGITSNLAQLAAGAVSFAELAVVGLATAGYGSLAQIAAQTMGEGVYNDMQAYIDEHGSLEGYRPEGADFALNVLNTIFQVGSEAILGVGSPRFFTGWSRGLWKEGVSGFIQEGLQGYVSDLFEVAKGNKEYAYILDNADQYLRDAIIGGFLQGALGAATYGTKRARADSILASAIAQSRGRKTPNKEDQKAAKDMNDAKERMYTSAFTEEFKKRFDATSPVGQLQQKVATAINDAAKAQNLDMGLSETQLAQRIEAIAAQETMNAMEDSAERRQSISAHELNNITYKDGALWLAGTTPETGARSISLARLLKQRQNLLFQKSLKDDKDFEATEEQKQKSVNLAKFIKESLQNATGDYKVFDNKIKPRKHGSAYVNIERKGAGRNSLNIRVGVSEVKSGHKAVHLNINTETISKEDALQLVKDLIAGGTAVSNLSNDVNVGFPLKQSRPDQSRLDKGDTYRGAYDEKLKRIILNEKSDLTTIQHEFAHYWIQNNFRWYRSGLASDDWKRNWERVESALGIEPTDKYLSKVASEKFARAYERYIMEGKVVPEYQWAFAEFQEFYNEVYEDLKAEYFDLNEELSPELIDWFNRQRPVAPEQVAEMRQNQVRSAIAQSPDNTVVEKHGDSYSVISQGENGEIESAIFVPKETVEKEKFGVARKMTKSGLQESLRKRFGDEINVDDLVSLNSAETLAEAEELIATNPKKAWEQMLSDSTNNVIRGYLYKAFVRMAENDPQIAIDLSHTNMAEYARELGQTIQAFNIEDELGLSPIKLLKNIEKSKGTMTEQQLTQALNEIDLYAELSAEDTTSLENETECLL